MLQIKKATNINISEVKPLILMLRREDNEQTDEELTLILQKAIKNNLLLVAFDDEKVVGYICGQFFDSTHNYFPNSIFLSELFVLPEYLGKGIGKDLVRYFLLQKYPENYKYFSLSHDPEEEHLTKYYKQFGFIEIGKSKSRNVLMKRVLAVATFPKITSSDNNLFDINEFAKNKFLVMVFYRGIWCNSCKKQLKEINDNLNLFENKNAKMVAVSADSAFKASLLKTFLKLKFPVLSDQELTLIKQFDLQIMEKGQWIAKPAVLIFDPSGNEIYRYVGQNHEDRPRMDEILAKIS